ncbi:MAG: hypothetical protein RBR45_12625 [Pseudomonas sp.]|jgi:hypothetical protein|nr:hypothetical protein [Pseudomonas sp.]
MKKIIFWLLIIAGCWAIYNRTSEVQLGPGVMAPADPQQSTLPSSVQHRVNEYDLTELAQFDIKAKVLSKKDYHVGREADLSPTDLALGWGNMSDESILEDIKISQSGRFYYWRVDSFPIPRKEIETHSANMHLIPANDSVKSTLSQIKKGSIIEMSGSLVNVMANNGDWRWSSSLTRNDTGNGACELVWVKSLRIVIE